MKWLADENFQGTILRGILRQLPDFDVLRAQDIHEVAGRDDVNLLDWATAEGRIVLTHDIRTMPQAVLRLLARQPRCVPVVLVPEALSIGFAINEIIILDQCSLPRDWESGLVRLPL